jgi:hypothetical protein
MIAKRPDIRRIRASMELGAGLKLGRVTPRRATVSERSWCGMPPKAASIPGRVSASNASKWMPKLPAALSETDVRCSPTGTSRRSIRCASGPRRHPDRSRQHLIRAAPISFHAVRRPVARGLHRAAQTSTSCDRFGTVGLDSLFRLGDHCNAVGGQQLMRLGICHIWRAAMRSLGNSTTPGAALQKQRRWRKQPRKNGAMPMSIALPARSH